MFQKDGITYETEQEYQFAKQSNVTEPKKRTTAESIWRVLAVVCVLIVLLIIISLWSEGSPPV
ncbi:MAG: hypothetical protein J5722_03670 [Oscillospiraceae bacterium]|nr:hypothetical protein [Oscillospiraceae bacterium]